MAGEMTAATQWAIVAIIFFLTTMFFAGLAQWCANRALAMAKAAARYQQQAGENAADANRWRLHRAARIRRDNAAAQRHDIIKAQTTAALRGEG